MNKSGSEYQCIKCISWHFILHCVILVANKTHSYMINYTKWTWIKNHEIICTISCKFYLQSLRNFVNRWNKLLTFQCLTKRIYRIICHNSVRFSGMVHGNRIHYLSTFCSLPFNLALFVGLNCIGDVSVLCYLPDKASWQIVQIGLGSAVKWYVSFIPVIDFGVCMNFLQISSFMLSKAKVSYVFSIRGVLRFYILSTYFSVTFNGRIRSLY